MEFVKVKETWGTRYVNVDHIVYICKRNDECWINTTQDYDYYISKDEFERLTSPNKIGWI